MLAAVRYAVTHVLQGSQSVSPIPHNRYLAQKGLQPFPNPVLLLAMLPDQQKPGMGPRGKALEL